MKYCDLLLMDFLLMPSTAESTPPWILVMLFIFIKAEKSRLFGAYGKVVLPIVVD